MVNVDAVAMIVCLAWSLLVNSEMSIDRTVDQTILDLGLSRVANVQ